jgi:hypothetical protein
MESRHLTTKNGLIFLDISRVVNALVLGYSSTNIVLIALKGEGFHLVGAYSMAFSTSLCVVLNAMTVIVITTILRHIVFIHNPPVIK